MLQSLNHYEKISSRSHSNYLAQISIEMTQTNTGINDVLTKLTALGSVLVPMNLVTGVYTILWFRFFQNKENFLESDKPKNTSVFSPPYYSIVAGSLLSPTSYRLVGDERSGSWSGRRWSELVLWHHGRYTDFRHYHHRHHEGISDRVKSWNQVLKGQVWTVGLKKDSFS